MKKFICILICIAVFACPFTTLAAPEFLGTDYAGNATYLMNILNPEQFSTITSNATCIVSAAAVQGTNVAVYLYDAPTGMYRKINTYINGVKQDEVLVGASGLYAQQVLLREGLNKILVYAKNGNDVQTIRLEVTLLGNQYVGSLKSYVTTKFN